jgi:hypothetical protein
MLLCATLLAMDQPAFLPASDGTVRQYLIDAVEMLSLFLTRRGRHGEQR